MKLVLNAGTTVTKGIVHNIQVEEDIILFTFDSKTEIKFNKEYYNENNFKNLANLLKNINVNSEGVFHINVIEGKVTVKHSSKKEQEFDQEVNSNITNSAYISSQPLIQGVFTQEPQGATDLLNQDVLNNFKNTPKS